MDPVEVSAKFAAYVWSIGRNGGRVVSEEEAISFARENWQAFLPNAHKGLGRLLIHLADVRSRRGRGRKTTARTITGLT